MEVKARTVSVKETEKTAEKSSSGLKKTPIRDLSVGMCKYSVV